MVMRVQQIGSELHIVLTAELVEKLNLTDGAKVEVGPVAEGPKGPHRQASFEEGMAAFQRTIPLHDHAYRELAK